MPLSKIFANTFVLIMLAGCQKELNFDNSTDGVMRQATFSVDNNCGSIKVNGVYTRGKNLTADNTISIVIQVDSVGSYIIRTDTINGIYFSVNGKFTKTGRQIINLQGSGRPSAEGNFNFTIEENSCVFTLTINSKDWGDAVFTFDGSPGPCTNARLFGLYHVGEVLTGLNKIKIDVNVIIEGKYSITTQPINGISFSGTGVLETMGYGVITLTAEGTPEKEGVYIFTPNNGCPFGVSVDP